MKKFIFPIIFGAIILVGGGFYGGMVFGKSQSVVSKDFAGQFGGINIPSGGDFRRIGSGAMRNNNAGMSSGKILSLDDKSVTIELLDGGSKIIYFSDTTEVMELTTGLVSDLTIDKQISVIGNTNDDGSITAKTIQIRPEIIPDNIVR